MRIIECGLSDLSSYWDCEGAHGGPNYERLIKNGQLILQLHKWNDGSDDHPNLEDPDRAPHGYGVLLWFETDGFDAAVKRVRAIKAKIVEEPHLNPASNNRDVWLCDLDRVRYRARQCIIWRRSRLARLVDGRDHRQNSSAR
jgi:hypothetical protein